MFSSQCVKKYFEDELFHQIWNADFSCHHWSTLSYTNPPPLPPKLLKWFPIKTMIPNISEVAMSSKKIPQNLEILCLFWPKVYQINNYHPPIGFYSNPRKFNSTSESISYFSHGKAEHDENLACAKYPCSTTCNCPIFERIIVVLFQSHKLWNCFA